MIFRSTERLTLREFGEEDWVGVHEYSRDARLTYYLNWGPNNDEQTKAFIRRAIRHQSEIPRTHFEFVIIKNETQKIIGNCRLISMLHRHRSSELHVIIRREEWGKGYGAEAIDALLALGFEDFKLHRIFSVVDPEDAASARVLEKCGFQREGHLREHLWVKGQWRDSLCYAILDYEWAQLNGKTIELEFGDPVV
ncbi:MAG: GNAT family N-acetyltransferase [Candidatus Hydrogenedentes bacterium]|nr:GNAT family N-acetyltransferase [Candidatus Hydrogenedentota bacterium]